MKTRILFLFIAFTVLVVAVASAQITSNGTGGGDWNTGTTWIGSAVPTGTDNVVILGSDVVTITTSGDTCANLTMAAGTTLNLNAASLTVPGTSWTLNAASTVIYTLTTTVQSAPVYGNLIYAAANGSPNGDLTVNGNLTITANTLRGISATTGSRNHTVAGDVILNGAASRISAVNSTPATNASCTWNIGGSVSLTGNSTGNRIILFESAGVQTGSAVFNINGNLSIGATSQIMLKSSSATSANYPEGIVNLKGNLVQDGTIGVNSVTTGTSPGLTINMIGTGPQVWSGSGAFSVSGFSVNININNAAGVTLSAPRAFNNNTVLNLTNGNLTTDATNLLTVSGTGTISGGSSSSFVNGPLAYANATAGAFSKTYPIGKGSIYRPLTLSLDQTAATSSSFKAEMFNSAPATNTLPGTLGSVSTVRHYTITEGGSAPSAFTAGIITLSYNVDDGVTDFNNLRIAKDDGAGNWVNLGGIGSANTSGTITSTTSFTTFGDFALGTALQIPNAPVLLEPADAAVDISVTPTLKWNKSATATSYTVEISASSSFTPLLATHTSADTSYTVAAALANSTVIYWRVNAANATGPSAWSQRSFTTIAPAPPIPNAPVLQEPADAAVDISVTPTLKWNKDAAATSYTVELSTSSSFTPVLATHISADTSYTVATALANSTVIYWRVNAANGSGSSAWSQRSFTTIAPAPPIPNAPVLIEPADTATNISVTPTLKWNTVANAASYTIELSTSSSFAPVLVTHTSADTSYTVATALANSTIIYWRVNAANATGSSTWSQRSFTTIASVGVEDAVLNINTYSLKQNYPNPFNPTTNIQFSVPHDGYASLKVYNMLGQEMATLFSGIANTGHYISVTFNASKLVSGIYFARLQYNGKSLVQRMLMTK
jgi:hypothetical protein